MNKGNSVGNLIYDCEFSGGGDYDRAFLMNAINRVDGASSNEFFRNYVHDMETVSQMGGFKNSVYDNVFANQHHIPWGGDAYSSWASTMIAITKDHYQDEDYILNNTFYCGAVDAIQISRPSDTGPNPNSTSVCYVENNIIYSLGFQANPYYQNSIIQYGAFAIGNGTKATIKNNLIYCPNSSATCEVGADVDEGDTPTWITVAQMEATSAGSSNTISGNLAVDPLFPASPSLPDGLALVWNSPAINAGLAPTFPPDFTPTGWGSDKKKTPVPFGGVYDIGAYESLNLKADITGDVSATTVTFRWDTPPDGNGLSPYHLEGPGIGGGNGIDPPADQTNSGALDIISSLSETPQAYTLTAKSGTSSLGSSNIPVSKCTTAVDAAKTWIGTVYLPQNLTINTAPGHLTIAPGTKVFFKYTELATYSLLVYGQLTALGTQAHPITFTSNYTGSPHSSWGSITFYGGSSGTMDHCTVEYAQIGVGFLDATLTIQNSAFRNNYYGLYQDGSAGSSASKLLATSTLENNGNAGMYLTASSTTTRLRRNAIRGSRYGIWCANSSSPTLDSNLVENHSYYGLRLENQSSPNLAGPTGPYWYAGGYNVIRNTNSYRIYASGYCRPFLGWAYYGGQNSIDGGYNTMLATGNCSVQAQSNYWGPSFPPIFPPLDGWFQTEDGSTIDHTLPLQNDPNTRQPLPKTGVGGGEGLALSALDSAFILERKGDLEGAETLYRRLLDDGSLDDATVQGATLGLSRLYQRQGRRGFLDLLASSPAGQAASSTGKKSDRLRILGGELDAFWLVQERRPQDALTRLGGLANEFPDNTGVARYCLEQRALITARELGQKEEALKLAAELQASYPDKDRPADELPILIEIASRLHAGAAGQALARDPNKEPLGLPRAFSLSEAYPNPFNPATSLRLALPAPAELTVVIYDVLGRKVATLASGFYEAGYHTLRWNAHSSAERPVSSGIYFARLEVKNSLGHSTHTKVAKLMLVK